MTIVRVTRVAALLALLPCTGCASYTTPGGPADLRGITNSTIREKFEAKPAATFPARLAVVRLQAPEYRSGREASYGHGNYSVVFARDVETQEMFKALASMPMVAGVAPLNRLVVAPDLSDDQAIREAAASLHADLLLVYTFDTVFRVKDHDIGPLGTITLGFSPNQEAKVTTTASAMILDVRTGYVYGLAEATAEKSKFANFWSSDDAVDDSRQATEAESLKSLLPEIQKLWNGILKEHAAPRTASHG